MNKWKEIHSDRAIFQIEESYIHPRVSLRWITSDSRIWSLLLAVSRRLSRDLLLNTSVGSRVSLGRFYQNQFFSELRRAVGFLLSLLCRDMDNGQTRTASSQVPYFVHIASHISYPDQTLRYFFFLPCISNANYLRDSKFDTVHYHLYFQS